MTSLILIEGPKDSGKTTIAWKVYLELKKYASAVRYWEWDGNGKVLTEQLKERYTEDDLENSVLNGTCLVDFRAVLTIRRQTFLINSAGDQKKFVHNGIMLGESMRVDGIIQTAQLTNPFVRNYIRWNLWKYPKLVQKTKKYNNPIDPRVKRHQDGIVNNIVWAVLNP